MGDSGRVSDVGTAPFGQDGGQGRRIVVIRGRTADKDIPAAARLKCRGSRAPDQDVPALSAEEPVCAAASDQHIVGAAARDVQNVVAVAREEQHRHVDIGQHSVDHLSGRLGDVAARLAVDDDVAGGEEAAVVDKVHAHLDAAAGHGSDGNRVIAQRTAHV